MQEPKRDRARGLPIHPLLIGVFPILSLLGHNIIEISPLDSLRVLVISIFMVGLVC